MPSSPYPSGSDEAVACSGPDHPASAGIDRAGGTSRADPPREVDRSTAFTNGIADDPLTPDHLRHIARAIERYLGSLCSVARNTRCGVLRTNQRRAVSDALSFFTGPRTIAHEACVREVLPRIGSNSAGRASDRLPLAECYKRAAMHHARVDELAHRWLAAGQLSDVESLELRAQLDALQNVYPKLLMLEEQFIYPMLLARHSAD